MDIPKEKLRWMYQAMVLSRHFEERLAKEFAKGVVPGFVHLSQGQEAIAVGAVGALRKDDYLCGTHRSHNHCIAKGETTKRIMAELFAKKTGSCAGKGGSMHISNPDLGMLGTNGIVGAGINIIGGAALSAKKRGTDQVGMVTFGDGACQTSAFHEGINLASIWNLPVIYVIENNGLAETTKISKAITSRIVATAPNKMPGIRTRRKPISPPQHSRTYRTRATNSIKLFGHGRTLSSMEPLQYLGTESSTSA